MAEGIEDGRQHGNSSVQFLERDVTQDSRGTNLLAGLIPMLYPQIITNKQARQNKTKQRKQIPFRGVVSSRNSFLTLKS
ncbi:hypothetical protein PG990_000331 [Apiospora arundinis]